MLFLYERLTPSAVLIVQKASIQKDEGLIPQGAEILHLENFIELFHGLKNNEHILYLPRLLKI